MGCKSIKCLGEQERKKKPIYYIHKLIGFTTNEILKDLNATLQCLCHIEPLVSYIKNFDKIKAINSYNSYNKKGECLTDSLKLLIDDIYSESNKQNKVKIIKTIDTFNVSDMILKIQNYDAANDFLINIILLRLHKELNKAEKETMQDNTIIDRNNKEVVLSAYANNFSKNYMSKISDFFFGVYYNFIVCNNCGNNTYIPKFFTSFIFNLEEIRKFKYDTCIKNLNLLYNNNNIQNFGIININDCLYYDRLGKPLPPNINSVCQKCGIITELNFQTFIYFFPKILIFIFNKENLNFNVRFNIEKQININFFSDVKENQIYDLIGMIFNPEENKFIAVCKSYLDKCWYLYDDANCKFINNIQSEYEKYDNPYMLIYKIDEKK